MPPMRLRCSLELTILLAYRPDAGEHAEAAGA